jgi:hypothetical protein
MNKYFILFTDKRGYQHSMLVSAKTTEDAKKAIQRCIPTAQRISVASRAGSAIKM